ncbi:protein slit-like [Sycon ciliatum]|uniref:protein slit-like n=1 Tax=Sycon ciliatum TaxID=27933 RepID=UPI0031F65AEC
MSCPASCRCTGVPWYTVNCNDGRLTMVPGGIPNTTITLRLGNNQIQTLSDGVFSDLTNLQTLDLYNNQIQTLSDGVFSGLTNLQSLYLDGNQIQTLSDGVFSGLTNLQTLRLDYNPLILTPSLYVSLYGIGTISANPCSGCVYVNSWVAQYLNQVSKSCAPGHFQKFNNNGSVDYYCRCNESVAVITPTCSSPGYTCLANGQFPICFGYTQCQKAGSTYSCTCEEELSLIQSSCYIAEDCLNTLEDCGNGNCTMDYPPESRINNKLNQPSNPMNGIYSTDTISAENTTLTVKCKTGFRNDQSAIQSTMNCQFPGTWTTLRTEPCRPFNCSDSPCDPKRQTCTDIEKGGFVCNCYTGYAKNFSTGSCDDIDECSTGDVCGSSTSDCVNQPGKYTCTCKVGYIKKGDNDCTGHELSIGLLGGAGVILVIIAVIVIIWSRREYKAKREETTRSKFHRDVFFSDCKQTTGMTYLSNNPAYSTKQEPIYEEIDLPDEANTKS